MNRVPKESTKDAWDEWLWVWTLQTERTHVSHDHRSFERNLSNCEQKPKKVRTSTGFEPVTSRYRSDALTNWAVKPLTLRAGHLWVLTSPWRMHVKWYMGSNPVEVLTFWGFRSQLLKLRSKLRWSWLTWFQIRSSMYETFHISLHIHSSRAH